MTNSSPTPQKPGHSFNDDFLLTPEEQALARSEFPTIFHVVDDPDLRAIVGPVDAKANKAKHTAQVAGIVAVALAVLALGTAASAPLWEKLPSPAPTMIAAISALVGIASMLISWAGVLYGKRKESWLESRFRIERFRQYQFQTLVWRLDEIGQSLDLADAAAHLTFAQTRKVWLDRIKQDLQNRVGSRITAVLESSNPDEAWLHPVPGDRPVIPKGLDMGPVFDAYRRLRFQTQLDYCHHKLRRGTESWIPWRLAPKQQAQVLGSLWMILVSGLVVCHVLVVGIHFSDFHFADSSLLHVVIVWLALCSIAARTVEHGLALPHELARYEDYRLSIGQLLVRFDAGTDREKLDRMVEMERLSFDELRRFLRAHREATFVL